MVLTAGINTMDKAKSEQLLDAYIDFQADATIKQKNFLNFQGYIKSKNLGFTQAQVGDIFMDLGNPDKKQEIIEKLEPKAPEVQEEVVQEIAEKAQEHKIEMTEATSKANQEKTIKMEELTNLLQDKPENAKENAKKIVDQAKAKLGQTIERYINKIKELKGANTEEISKLKDELKREKEAYEKAKKDFFAKDTNKFENFSEEDLKNVPPGLIRYEQRQGKLFNSPKRNKMDSIRRNKTIHTLIKKFNKIGDDTENGGKDGVRFIMGFEKARFLRYAGIKVHSAIDKAGSAISMQMNPQQFHTKFNAGRNNIFAILDKKTSNENNPQEIATIQAIKNRINYYGTLYARERANARVGPFIDAEKNATEKGKIIQISPNNVANAA